MIENRDVSKNNIFEFCELCPELVMRMNIFRLFSYRLGAYVRGKLLWFSLKKYGLLIAQSA